MLEFEIGKLYNRRQDIHGRYAGQQYGGICTPTEYPLIFLFTGEAGQQYGYHHDGWNEDGIFRYTGEGQVGDMQFQKGNKAVRDHIPDGKDLLLFQSLGQGQPVRYLGRFACSSWEYSRGPDRNRNDRQIIIFHLHPLEGVGGTDLPQQTPEAEPSSIDLETLRAKAYEAAQSSGENTPRQGVRSYQQRSQAVRSYVLTRAKGVCETCREPAPFLSLNKQPYLEPHHARRMSDGGPDHPRWVGALCPNCHKQMHHGLHGAEVNSKLIAYLGTVERDV